MRPIPRNSHQKLQQLLQQQLQTGLQQQQQQRHSTAATSERGCRGAGVGDIAKERRLENFEKNTPPPPNTNHPGPCVHHI